MIPAGFTENKGEMPASLKGKRVLVILANGKLCGEDASPRGWPADGPQGCRWDLTPGGFDFDIRAWRKA